MMVGSTGLGPGWVFGYDRFDPDDEGHRETLCTLGNGYVATRGAAEWAAADDVHYPGTYLAGGYDRLVSDVAGRPIENEDLVNLPNWLWLQHRTGDGEWFDLRRVTIEDYRAELLLDRGLFQRTIRYRDTDGRETTYRSRRIVHMDRPHLMAMEIEITPHGWSGPVVVRSGIDGTVENRNVERYRDLDGRHLRPVDVGVADATVVFLVAETVQSGLRVALAANSLAVGDGAVEVEREAVLEPGRVAQDLMIEAREDMPIRVLKVVAMASSRDRAVSEPSLTVRQAVRDVGSFDDLLASHHRAWAYHWRRCDVEVGGRGADLEGRALELQTVLRLNIFHVLETACQNSVDLDVSVPARGWHGEAYRGHIFWDELFILPFVDFALPEVSASLLRYRYHRLPAARDAARAIGHRGAMFPWQSGSDGREETQVLHLNPRSGRWLPDASHLQRHVGAAIAYNVWRHYRLTLDHQFLRRTGAELIVEIARFFASLSTYDPERGRYEIVGVMGPDEYHEAYPDADEPGLRNNAYTNVMAAWVADVAMRTLDEYPESDREELRERLGLTGEEIETLEAMRCRMFVPFHDGVISQFEGYEDLDELDWDGYRRRYGDIHRLDRILEAEDDNTDRYKVSKQADVLMLAYLFSDRELAELFGRLGYPFDGSTLARNYAYYHPRTVHGSTLSAVVHAAVSVRCEPEHTHAHFLNALRGDVADLRAGTTKEGIHLGAAAASVDLVQRVYTGLELRDDTLSFDPAFPAEMGELTFSLNFRSAWLDLRFAAGEVCVHPRAGGPESVRIAVRGEVHDIPTGSERVIPYLD